jgi:hypothetical protein
MDANKTIIINAGGKLFELSYDLLNINTYLCNIVHGNWLKKRDQQGNIFIEHESKFFKLILQHLHMVLFSPHIISHFYVDINQVENFKIYINMMCLDDKIVVHQRETNYEIRMKDVEAYVSEHASRNDFNLDLIGSGQAACFKNQNNFEKEQQRMKHLLAHPLEHKCDGTCEDIYTPLTDAEVISWGCQDKLLGEPTVEQALKKIYSTR